MTTYLVNEVFYSIQGEGHWSGRPAVFVRFSRCNLWTGREEDRARAVCRFCDTDFRAGRRLSLDELLDQIHAAGPGSSMVVLTGGEPGLQVDAPLIKALRGRGRYVAIETNGTIPLPSGINWVCVSPKHGTELKVTRGHELKVVFPQPGMDITDLPIGGFRHLWLSPMDGPQLHENTNAAYEYALANPAWRLNVQTHKMIGVR